MVQGAENDLLDIRFYLESTPVIFNRDNEPFEDLNNNILTVDNKAILARDTASATASELAAHIGNSGFSTLVVELVHGAVGGGPFLVGEAVSGGTSLATGVVNKVNASSLIVGSILSGPFLDTELITGGGSGATANLTSDPVPVPEHADATTGVSGFMPASDKAKLNLIQDGAQLNILAPVDAIELISRKVTTLHSHLLVTTLTDGFMSAADKTKLDGVQAGAQVNNISAVDAATLTGGGNADALHGHFFSAGSETFTAAVHLTTDHAGLPGIGGFPGFVEDAYNLGPVQTFAGQTVFPVVFPFSTLDVVVGGMTHFLDFGIWGASEEFRVDDLSKAALTGTITYSCIPGGAGDIEMRGWIGGFGLA